MKQLEADIKKHVAFMNIAKINKKVFIPNFINELIALPIRFFILCVIWFAIFKIMGTDTINGFSKWKMIIYYFVYATIMHITMYYRQLPYTVWNDISQGNLSKFICRPISYVKYHFFYGLGYTYYSSMICIPIVIFASLYFCNEIIYLVRFIFFMISIMLGIMITFYIYILIGLLTFWVESIFGYRDLIVHIGAVFSGSIIPLSFMPYTFQVISYFLPFRYMIYEPIGILLNELNVTGFLFIIVRQLLLIIILSFISNKVWHCGLCRYEAQGS